MKTTTAVASCDLSVGCAVVSAGTSKRYAGKLLNPLTWLKFETVVVVRPVGIDHVAVIKSS